MPQPTETNIKDKSRFHSNFTTAGRIFICSDDQTQFNSLTRRVTIYHYTNLQKTPVSQQDQATIKLVYQQQICETLASQEITILQPLEIYHAPQEHQEESLPSESTTDHHSVNALVHPVEPVLGTTHIMTLC